jgi:folate-binding protein YgfZ
MKLYRLRAKVDFEDVSADTAVCWTAGNEGPKTRWAISYSDNRNALVGPGKERALGRRWLVPRAEIDAGSDASDAFAAARIASGIAELGADFAPDTLFPHDIGMDLLGGVDFKKGCYIGQEVVSRMQHRGTARRRPVLVDGTTAPSGTPILVGGRDSGQIGRAVDGRAIGIVRLDRFDGGDVTVDGQSVTISIPDWATYRLGESAVAD